MRRSLSIYVILLSATAVTAQELVMGTEEFWAAIREGAKARATLMIVDDDGEPVPEANVGAHFQMNYGPGIEGRTDANGVFVLKGLTRGQFHYGVEKDGYYTTIREVKLLREGVTIQDGKWQPWDPVITTVLRRVVNPIPMYARKVEAHIPALDAVVGYDLVIGDWVQPDGSGIHADLNMVLSARIENISDYDIRLSVAFDEPFNGIAKEHEAAEYSEFRSARFAPLVGYESAWSRRVGHSAELGSLGRLSDGIDDIYYIRTRSKVDEAGSLKEAMYGKLYGSIHFRSFQRADGPYVIFTYYLNPTPNDRNMEFDPGRNLFQNLGSLEDVTAP